MASETDIKRLADTYGVKGDTIRAIIGLSKPLRKLVKIQLTMFKEQLQGFVLWMGYKASLSDVHRQKAVKYQQTVTDQVSRVKSVLNMLNISNDFQKTASLQPLVGLLVSSSSTGSKKVNSFTDLEAVTNKAAYQTRRAVRAMIIAETTARKLNNKINEVAKYIAILDEIEKWPA